MGPGKHGSKQNHARKQTELQPKTGPNKKRVHKHVPNKNESKTTEARKNPPPHVQQNQKKQCVSTTIMHMEINFKSSVSSRDPGCGCSLLQTRFQW